MEGLTLTPQDFATFGLKNATSFSLQASAGKNPRTIKVLKTFIGHIKLTPLFALVKFPLNENLSKFSSNAFGQLSVEVPLFHPGGLLTRYLSQF